MPSVALDRAFLESVYVGEDLDGFARFVARAALDPNFLVFAERPATLGVLELGRDCYDLGKTAYGHHLVGDWRLLPKALRHVQALKHRAFLYPIRAGRSNTFDLFNVLTKRHGFEPYHAVLVKRFG